MGEARVRRRKDGVAPPRLSGLGRSCQDVRAQRSDKKDCGGGHALAEIELGRIRSGTSACLILIVSACLRSSRIGSFQLGEKALASQLIAIVGSIWADPGVLLRFLRIGEGGEGVTWGNQCPFPPRGSVVRFTRSWWESAA